MDFRVKKEKELSNIFKDLLIDISHVNTDKILVKRTFLKEQKVWPNGIKINIAFSYFV